MYIVLAMVVLSPPILSVSGKELILYGGVDSEDAEMCTAGLYVFDTGEVWTTDMYVH